MGDSSDEEEDEILMLVVLAVVVAVCEDSYQEVYTFNVRERMSFQNHADMLQREGLFKNYYRMTYEQLFLLRDLLKPHIPTNELQGGRRSQGQGPILLESIMNMGLRYLAVVHGLTFDLCVRS